jgi:plasmid maintenance system antidote protein VapI
MQTTGLDLKLERVAARVPGRALAEALGVSDGRVSHIEALAVVTPAMVLRYHAALDACRTTRTVA